jgi:hypothetical protein
MTSFDRATSSITTSDIVATRRGDAARRRQRLGRGVRRDHEPSASGLYSDGNSEAATSSTAESDSVKRKRNAAPMLYEC